MIPHGTTHTTVRLESEDERQIFLEEFNTGCWVSQHYDTGSHVVPFDPSRHPFAQHICRLLVDKGLVLAEDLARLPSLEKLHEVLPASLKELDESELNEVSRRFYDQDAEFLAIYQRFLKEVVCEQVIGDDCVFQRTPTIRFHFPHPKGFNWAPRYHSDIMLGHPPQEVNLWLPITRAYGSNSMRLAELDGSLRILRSVNLDFPVLALQLQHNPELQRECETVSAPVELNYGQMVVFDSRCLHATQYNTTDSTRISIDLRVVPFEDYRSMRIAYRGTGRRRMLFQRGHYYDERTTAEL